MKKIIALLLAFVVMSTLCACGGAGSSASSGADRKQADYGLYIKDAEFFFTDLKNDAWQITARLADDEDAEDEEMAVYGSVLSYYTTVSSDGSLVFFPDKVSGSGGVNLYYRKTDSAEGEAVKIDSDVTRYTVNSDATLVTYTKGTGEDCNLYQYSLKEDAKEKIVGSVKDYDVSEDGSRILCVTTDGTLYAKNAGEDRVKIAGDIMSLVSRSADYSTVYYIKDEALYRQPVGGDREKIDSDIYQIIRAYETGEIYYLRKNTEEEPTLMDYVVDDMKAADEAAPTDYPYKPRSYNYDTTEEYDQAYAEYEAAYEAYYAKEARDECRADLAGRELSDTTYALCFYSGTEKTVITDAFSVRYAYTAAAEKPVISYVAYDQEAVEKTKLSAVMEANDISVFQERVENALFSSYDRYIALGSAPSVLKQEKAAAIRINGAGTEVYFVDDVPDGKDAGDLYKVTIADNVVGEPELYDSDVSVGSCYFLSDSGFLYFKDLKDGTGDLYLNKAKVDYDVSNLSLGYNEKQDKLYYMIDWDSEKCYGTLKEYAGGETVKIADDVYSYAYIPDGRVLYLYDYSLKYYAGELHLWENGESRMIDDDVIYLVSNSSTAAELQLLTKQLYGNSAAPAAAAWTEAPAW